MNVSVLLLTVEFVSSFEWQHDWSKKEEIEEIYFFEVNTKYISSSELKI